MHNSLLHLFLENCNFLNTDISQGSVATRLGCGGVFTYDFVTNFLLSLTVKEFWKYVNIWWSYGQELGVLFFDSQCRLVLFTANFYHAVCYVVFEYEHCTDLQTTRPEDVWKFLLYFWSEVCRNSWEFQAAFSNGSKCQPRLYHISNGMGFQRNLGTAVSLFAVTVVCCK